MIPRLATMCKLINPLGVGTERYYSGSVCSLNAARHAHSSSNWTKGSSLMAFAYISVSILPLSRSIMPKVQR
jgi:hypothetical protein